MIKILIMLVILCIIVPVFADELPEKIIILEQSSTENYTTISAVDLSNNEWIMIIITEHNGEIRRINRTGITIDLYHQLAQHENISISGQ